jgi:hypothetical protein
MHRARPVSGQLIPNEVVLIRAWLNLSLMSVPTPQSLFGTRLARVDRSPRAGRKAVDLGFLGGCRRRGYCRGVHSRRERRPSLTVARAPGSKARDVPTVASCTSAGQEARSSAALERRRRSVDVVGVESPAVCAACFTVSVSRCVARLLACDVFDSRTARWASLDGLVTLPTAAIVRPNLSGSPSKI